MHLEFLKLGRRSIEILVLLRPKINENKKSQVERVREEMEIHSPYCDICCGEVEKERLTSPISIEQKEQQDALPERSREKEKDEI